MNVTCSKCGMENAYHNGVCYECPDCDNEWGDGMNFYDDDEDNDDFLDDEY